jgi:hypothetical protein
MSDSLNKEGGGFSMPFALLIIGGGFFSKFTSALKGTETRSTSAGETPATQSSGISALSPLTPLTGLETGAINV